jgi:hypothetical protein
MTDPPRLHDEDDEARAWRSQRRLFSATILLAAIGAPLFMQGAVIFTQSITRIPTGPSSALWGLGVFALSATPLGLAAYTWRRHHGFQEPDGPKEPQ